MTESDSSFRRRRKKRSTNYFKPRKVIAMREIRRMIIAGYLHTDIQRQLNLPMKTYYRYFDACFKEDRAHMTLSITPIESLNQLAIVQERLNKMYQNMHAIATDPIVDAEVRIQAENLAAELAVGVLKSWEDSPLGGLGVLRRVQQETAACKELVLLSDEQEKKRQQEAESL